jgi:PhoH-like ATPase
MEVTPSMVYINKEPPRSLHERRAKNLRHRYQCFIHRPDALLSFRDNNIVIPLWVLEELDKLKSGHEERARNARQAIRLIDTLGRRGKLSEGFRSPEINSTLTIGLSYHHEPALAMDLTRMDNKIVLCALKLKHEGQRVFFVSKDINARVKATALGIHAVDYEKAKVQRG